jgi:parvulin-like peptidyl-prolyl isomerase
MAKDSKKTKVTSKKHLARMQKERRQNMIIAVVGIIVVVIVVVMVGYGFIENYIIIPQQPVAIVNNDEISTHEYQVNVKYSRQKLIEQYLQTRQLMDLFADDPNNQSFFQQNINQILIQLESNILGQTVLDQLIDDRLIRQEADRRNIVVTSEEIDQAMAADFNYYPDGTPTPLPSQEIAPTSTFSSLQKTLIPPTETPTSTPTQTEQTATPSPSVTPTSEPTLTPTPFTEEMFLEQYDGYLNYLDDELGISEDDLRRIYESQILYEKVKEAVLSDVAREVDQVWARHILVEDLETAEEVTVRLNNGEDFTVLAVEYSTDPGSAANGGDLGWFGLGQMVPEFEKIAFNLNIGQISDPVETQFGWHIIQALGHEMRPVSEFEFDQITSQAFEDWLDDQRESADIEIFDYWEERTPTEPTIPPQLLG